VSTDSDSGLVSIENLSEILLSKGWAQVRYQQPKTTKNQSYSWRYSQKKETIKNFVHCWLEDLPSLFRIWTALLRNRLTSYAVGKPTEIFLDFLRFPCMIYF